jgi:hypothetical protein
LRVLAERTGTTFAVPDTRGEASRDIERLQRLPSVPSSERRDERARLAADRERFQLSPAIHTEEISGYGSTATWTANRE